MPFSPDNPPDKVRNLPAKKQRQWVHVFNSCFEEHGDDAKCHKMAWGVTGAGKKSSVDWEEMESKMRARRDPDSIEEKVARELVAVARLLAFHAEKEADKVYKKSLKRPYWKEVSEKFPDYNSGDDTDDAVKWIRNQIADDFKGDHSEEDWTLIEAELTSMIHGGLT